MGTLMSDSFTDRAFPHSLLGHEIVWVDKVASFLLHSVVVSPIHYSLIILPYCDIGLATDSVVE